MNKVCREIQEIMATYREQDASPQGVDTPGGLEHMGDVWRLLRKWDSMLSVRDQDVASLVEMLERYMITHGQRTPEERALASEAEHMVRIAKEKL